MPEQQANQRSPSPSDRGARKAHSSYALSLGGQELRLGQGEYVIGRGPAADFRIDSPTVSRRHAKLVVGGDGVVIEDLSSRNGVFVNDVLVRRAVPLERGDRIRIGEHQLALTWARPGSKAVGAEPRRGPASQSYGRTATLDDPSTGRADPLELLSTIVEHTLAEGDAAEAESIVSGHLSVLLREARTVGSVKAETCERAARYALQLAEGTKKGSWLGYVFDLYLATGRLVPLPIVAQLFRVAPLVRMEDPSVVKRYTKWLRGQKLGADQPLVLHRLERFSRL